MKTTDTIRVTSTSANSIRGDALGRGTPEDLEEADFVTLIYATLHQVAEHALTGAAPFGQRHADGSAIRAGAEALQRYMSSNPDMSLLGTFTTVHQLIADDASPANDAGPFACPACGEADIDNLCHIDDNEIECDTCGAVYTTDQAGGTDTRAEWFRLKSGLIFRAPAPHAPYVASAG